MSVANIEWNPSTRNFARKRPLFRLGAKRQVEGFSTVQKKRRRRIDAAVFEQKRTLTFEPMSTNQLRRSKRYIRYQPYSLKKHLYPAALPVEDRFQGLTNFDTNNGYKRISFSGQTNSVPWLPIHIFDLTSFQEGANVPVVGRAMAWTNRTTTADLAPVDIFGQAADGGPNANLKTWTVTDTPTSAIAATPRVFLKWVKLSFNLYGARKRTTQFKLHIVRFKQYTSNFFINSNTREAKELVQYLERPLIFNNLQVGETECRKKMHIIKTYSWTVQPQTADSLNTTTGNIVEANVFLRMNKCLNLHWPDEGTHEAHAVPTGEANDGIDYETRTATLKTGPNYGSRVYAILTAFSPEYKDLGTAANGNLTPSEAYAATGSGGIAIDAAVEPSYDFLIRRGYTVEAN